MIEPSCEKKSLIKALNYSRIKALSKKFIFNKSLFTPNDKESFSGWSWIQGVSLLIQITWIYPVRVFSVECFEIYKRNTSPRVCFY